MNSVPGSGSSAAEKYGERPESEAERTQTGGCSKKPGHCNEPWAEIVSGCGPPQFQVSFPWALKRTTSCLCALRF